MTDVDLVLLAIIAISALLGLWRGLIRVLVSLAAWLLGGIAAFLFGSVVAQFLAGAADPRPVHLLAGYGAAFIGAFLVVVAIGWVVRRLVQSIGLSGVDRALGLAFGVVRGAFIACLLVLVMGFTSFPQRPGWRDSQLLPLLLPGAQWASTLLPDWSALPITPADAIRGVGQGNIDLNGAGLSGADLNSNRLEGVGLSSDDPAGTDSTARGSNVRDSNGRDSGKQDPRGHASSNHDSGMHDSNRHDSNGNDSRSDKPNSSNNGDAFALPQPGG